jgi:hypothetical protein
VIWWLVACVSREPAPHAKGIVDVPTVSSAGPPSITSAEVSCDVDSETWTFHVDTDAWTGGGWVWLSDGEYVEKTRMPSVAAARDGSSDELEVKLALKVDFRSSGGTVFPCASDPYGLLFVDDVDDAIVDCRWFGPDNSVWSGLGEGGCAVGLE